MTEIYTVCTLGARGFFFRSEAASVSDEAAIVILPRAGLAAGLAASPLTIAASLRKKEPSGTQGILYADGVMIGRFHTRGRTNCLDAQILWHLSV